VTPIVTEHAPLCLVLGSDVTRWGKNEVDPNQPHFEQVRLFNCTKRTVMKTTRKTRRTGLIVQPDDLEVGQFYAVYGLKNGSEEPVQISGMAFKLLAMNLPFVVGKMAADPAHPPLTFDTRFLNFMRVTDEFAQAQRPETPA
jgi:hypothetical protein